MARKKPSKAPRCEDFALQGRTATQWQRFARTLEFDLWMANEKIARLEADLTNLTHNRYCQTALEAARYRACITQSGLLVDGVRRLPCHMAEAHEKAKTL